MATYNSGVIISVLREKRGLSQEKLAELSGCERTTISRIESNKIYNPDKRTIENIFKALKVDHKRFTSFLSSQMEIEIDEKKQKINQLINKRDYAQVKILVSELEDNKHYKINKFERQFLLRVKATMLLNNETYDFNKVSIMLKEAMFCTVPDFHEDNIECNLYNYEEIIIINMMSNLYFKSGNVQKAYDILIKLRSCLEKDYIPRMERAGIYIMILYNLSKYAGLLEKYEEALNICDAGITECLETNNYKRLPELYFNKAFDLYYLNRQNESLELFIMIKSLCEAQHNYALLEFTVRSVKGELNIDL